MKVKYAVTFEFATRAPLTHRGVVEATSAGTCTRRAVQEAQKAVRPIAWTSMNVVLLERLDSTDEDDAQDAQEDAAGASSVAPSN